MSSIYSIADQVPSPCFVLEEAKLRKNLALIKNVADEAGIEIILAFKGFSMWSAFPIVREYVKGATASSLNEALLCKEEMGVKPHTYCVAYTDDEFEAIACMSSHLTFNSLSQYERFKSHPELKGVSCGLRVNPEYSEVKTELYNPSASTSRLGITRKHLGDKLPDGIEGLHFHVLCENNSYTLENTLKAFEDKFSDLLHQAKWVNMGGGHLMTHKDYDTAHLISILKKFKAKYDVNIILEPGSAFAWQSGDLVTTVIDVVENGEVETAIMDASFTAHMPDCLEMPYKPEIEGASSEEVDEGYHCRIGGTSCLAGDYMSAYTFQKPLAIGDKLIFKDMIHYTMVKTSFFNGVKHPNIGILKSDGQFELVKSFGYEEYKAKLS